MKATWMEEKRTRWAMGAALLMSPCPHYLGITHGSFGKGMGEGAWRRWAVTTALGRAAPGKAWKSRAHLHGDTSEC